MGGLPMMTTTIPLEEAGLPECPRSSWMQALEALGWEGGGLYEPGPRDVALWYRKDRQAFALAVDVVWREPVSYRLIEGTPDELAAWLEEHRPEFASGEADTPCSGATVYRRVHAYADDPAAVDAWWKLCEDVRAGRIGLALDLGDA